MGRRKGCDPGARTRIELQPQQPPRGGLVRYPCQDQSLQAQNDQMAQGVRRARAALVRPYLPQRRAQRGRHPQQDGTARILG